MNIKIEMIQKLYNKGYSYNQIAENLAEIGILTDKSSIYTKMSICKFIKRNKMIKSPENILLDKLYFSYDLNTLSNMSFTTKLHQLKKFINLREKVEKTSEFLNKSEYENNIKNYDYMIYKMRKKLPFKVFNDVNYYATEKLLAIQVIYDERKYIILKKDIINWLTSIDQYVVFSEDRSICLQVNKIYKKNGRLNLFLSNKSKNEYLYILEHNDSTFINPVSINVVSAESFKMIKKCREKEYLIKIHAQGKIDNFYISDEVVYEMIKQSKGIKPLTMEDFEDYNKLNKILEYNSLLENNLFFI